jgi:hypothetical protein
MSLLYGIKQHQLPVSSIELEIKEITEEEDWDLIEIVKVYAIKMPNTGDYNSAPVLFYLVTSELIFIFKRILIMIIIKIILL